MPFISRNQVKQPRPVGRPPKQIPVKLVQILDETFTRNSAYEDDVTGTPADDLREVINMGELHAQRRGLSFRHRINEDREGHTILTMWLCPKNSYRRRRAA